MPTRAYLSLGSNLGDRASHLRQALTQLSTLGTLGAVSSFYETEPVEFTAQPWFLNCVLALETDLPPQRLLEGILAIEKGMGRERTQPKGPRLIDIDIVLFGNSVVRVPGLTVPHPALHERRFVLAPLAEIAPDARHPVLQLTMWELLLQLPPGQRVRKVE